MRNSRRIAGILCILLGSTLLIAVSVLTVVAVAAAAPRSDGGASSRSILTAHTSSPCAVIVAPSIDDEDDDDAIDDDGGDASLALDNGPTVVIVLVRHDLIATVAPRPSSLDVRVGVDTPRAPPHPSHTV